MLFLSVQAAAPASDANGAMMALLAIAGVALAWFGARTLMQRMRAARTDAVVHGDFAAFALEALVNAAKLDGRFSEPERAAIVAALDEITGGAFDAAQVDVAHGRASLSKGALIDYLGQKSSALSHAQKLQFLKALLRVFIADGVFDETEHHALVEYTAAIGFDRPTAAERLRGLMGAMTRDQIT